MHSYHPRQRKSRAKAPKLNLPYTFFILVTLGGLMLVIEVRPVGRGKGVEYMDKSQPQKPDALMSRRAPDSVLAEAKERDSPENS